MLEPPGQSSAGRAADGGARTGSGTGSPEPAGAEPGPPPGHRPGWGHLPAWAGVLMVLAAATLGAALTVASDRDPGRTLGILVLAGTLAAATSVGARSAYAITPLPWL
jgi:hypothetical protein